MKVYTINILNQGYKINPHDKTVVFKNKNQACRMIRNWSQYNPNTPKTNIFFEIKKDYYPFSFANLDKYRDVLEETWRTL